MNKPRFPLPQVAKPAGGGTAILYDDLKSGLTITGPEQTTNAKRFRVVAYVTGQNMTFYHKWSAHGQTTQRVFNGDGSGETVTAGTLFQRNCLLLPGRNQFSLVAGGTAPTLYEVSCELDEFGGLGQ